MLNLRPEELTGRTRTHVMEVPEPRCTLHPDAAAAFLALRAAAGEAGIDLIPVSSFRDFERQLTLWNEKFHGQRPLLDRDGQPLERSGLSDVETIEAILMWSALPGASRHHWGTDLDVIDGARLLPGQQAKLVPHEYAAGGVFEHLHQWLASHAEGFGFFRPYDLDRGGVQPEPWHLSYAPLADTALSRLTVGVLHQALSGVDLAGATLVQAQLDSIHQRYVKSVATPSRTALAARRVSPATRPS
jgi:LAS superfamily LD-carboxypeptidase LdcB